MSYGSPRQLITPRTTTQSTKKTMAKSIYDMRLDQFSEPNWEREYSSKDHGVVEESFKHKDFPFSVWTGYDKGMNLIFRISYEGQQIGSGMRYVVNRDHFIQDFVFRAGCMRWLGANS